MTSDPCAACLRPELRFFGPCEGHEYHRCGACHSIQLVPLPTAAELDQAYAEQYSAAGHYADMHGNADAGALSRANAAYHRAMCRALAEIVPEQAKVLDYGCGYGGLIGLLKEAGFNAEGLDLSAELVNDCQARGLSVKQGDIASVPRHAYGALVMSAVFEHLSDYDGFLRECDRVLEPGGVLLTFQPTAPHAWFFGQLFRLGRSDAPLPRLAYTFTPPWHTLLISPAGMKAMAQRNGFELVGTWPAPQGRSGGLTQVAQVGLHVINKLAWPVFKEKWPLVTGHIFVLKKASHRPGGA